MGERHEENKKIANVVGIDAYQKHIDELADDLLGNNYLKRLFNTITKITGSRCLLEWTFRLLMILFLEILIKNPPLLDKTDGANQILMLI